jgi:hypothetical protein
MPENPAAVVAREKLDKIDAELIRCKEDLRRMAHINASINTQHAED